MDVFDILERLGEFIRDGWICSNDCGLFWLTLIYSEVDYIYFRTSMCLNAEPFLS